MIELTLGGYFFFTCPSGFRVWKQGAWCGVGGREKRRISGGHIMSLVLWLRLKVLGG